MPRQNPNDPPTIETDALPPTMPEQQHIEPKIAPPPTVEVDEPTKKENPNRPWTQEEEDWARVICPRVKRVGGGFIKGLSQAGKDKATAMMAKYGTKPEEGWAKKPFIPRFDNASHAANQKHIFEKPVKMITVTK